MADDKSTQIHLSEAERSAGLVVEVEHAGRSVLVEVPAGTRVGAQLRARAGDTSFLVEVCDRPWGLDGGARLDLAPRSGAVRGDGSFWARAIEELVQSVRAKHEFAGAVFAEQRGDRLVLTGMSRRAVGPAGQVTLDPSWGSLLWHTRPGLLSAVTAFSAEDKRLARRLGRPLVTLSHTVLSPSVAANFLFPLGFRPFMIAAGIKGLLALDQRRRGMPLLLGRSAAARVVYPNGEVALVEHDGAGLPRDLYDRAAFAVDRTLGRAESRARKLLKDVVETAILGRPPGS